jgi:predicted RND superfamily exporter protein
MVKMEEYLIGSQIECLVLALVVITLLMSVLLRSVVLGLFSMIPNLTPIAIGLGAMSLAGVSLNPGTVMIGAVALGIVVDDTVHFMVALRRALADRSPVDEAIRVALSEVGPALAVTTLLLAASFLVLTLGSFAPSIQFGAITTLIVVVALAADLVLLPAALRLSPWALNGLRDR